MEEIERFDDIKLNQLRADIHAGIASGDAGTLDADQIKRRVRVRQAEALLDTERRYEAGQNNLALAPSPSQSFANAASEATDTTYQSIVGKTE